VSVDSRSPDMKIHRVSCRNVEAFSYSKWRLILALWILFLHCQFVAKSVEFKALVNFKQIHHTNSWFDVLSIWIRALKWRFRMHLGRGNRKDPSASFLTPFIIGQSLHSPSDWSVVSRADQLVVTAGSRRRLSSRVKLSLPKRRPPKCYKTKWRPVRER
jgi:hypothetical protein